MQITENIRLAIRGLRANKLRAALTMLGIMIGVGAVITLLSIGNGVNRFVADQFAGLGTNLVFILPGDDPSLAESTLTVRDAQELADVAVLPSAEAVAPLYVRGISLRFGRTTHRSTLRATTPEYGPLRGFDVARGRFIDASDVIGRSRVVVIGAETAYLLFPEDVDPLGATIKVAELNFRVIGVLEQKGANFFGSQDDTIIVPLSTAQERLLDARSRRTGQLLLDVILVQAVNRQAVEDVVVDASNALRKTHSIAFRDEDDFLVMTQQDFLSTFGQVIGVLTLFLGAIASISLLVGGIGIMNIMLVSVTERTREIGLRKAVGARRRDILGQFLTEAVVLSLSGGLLGLGIGLLGSAGIGLAVPDLKPSVTVNAVLLAVGFSLIVGLFFGIYPATRASRLHPIDALRFE